MNRTRGSKHIIRNGLVSTVVTICRKSVFSSSIGAMIDSSPVSFLNRWARYFRITGPYVSGKKKNNGHDAPAKIAPIQKAHDQLITEIKPLMGGPSIGPKVVAACPTYEHCKNVSFGLRCADHENRHTPSSSHGVMVDVCANAADN